MSIYYTISTNISAMLSVPPEEVAEQFAGGCQRAAELGRVAQDVGYFV